MNSHSKRLIIQIIEYTNQYRQGHLEEHHFIDVISNVAAAIEEPSVRNEVVKIVDLIENSIFITEDINAFNVHYNKLKQYL